MLYAIIGLTIESNVDDATPSKDPAMVVWQGISPDKLTQGGVMCHLFSWCNHCTCLVKAIMPTLTKHDTGRESSTKMHECLSKRLLQLEGP